MIQKAFFVVVLNLFLTFLICHAQTQPAPVISLPDQVPPPSDAATLGKYGDIPLNMSSGAPNISVPFYEIKTSRLSLPITLNYDASGIKVDQIASWVGLNWSLDAGGVITRTVNGKDDFDAVNGYYEHAIPPDADTVSENSSAEWTYLNTVGENRIDTKPDYFFYNFSGHSGQFIFGEDKQPIDIHHQEPLKIRYATINGVRTFNIVDGTGNQYIFSANQNDESYTQGMSNEMIYSSSWYLTQVISCDKTDTLKFSYYTDNQLTETSLTYGLTLNDLTTPIKIISQGLTGQLHQLSNPLRLQSITFKNGKVTFYSSGPRTDVNENKLDSIVVSRYNFSIKNYQPYKTMILKYGYYQTGSSYRLRLDSVRISGASGENGGKYSFVYNQNPLPLLHSMGRDLFNYYNGKDGNTTLVPNTAVSPATASQLSLQLADRNTYDQYMENGILQRIYYPTSGYSEFTYEPNAYGYLGQKSISPTASTGAESRHVEALFTPSATVSADVFFNISAYAGGPMTSGALYQGTTVVATVYVDPNNGVKQHKVITLTGGVQYKLVADAPVNVNINTSAFVSATWSVPDTDNTSKAGGGLRVAQIKNYDINGNYLNGQTYKYGWHENGNGHIPAGSISLNTFNQEGQFYYGDWHVPYDGGPGECLQHYNTYDVFSSSSIYDCFNLGSQSISYPEVSKYQVDQNGNALGKSVYDYSLYTVDVHRNGSFLNPDVLNSGFEGGTLLSQADYSYKSGVYQPVKRVFFRYDSIGGNQGRVFKAADKYQMTGCYIDGFGGTIQHNWGQYPVTSGSVLPVSQTIYDYDNNDTTKYLIIKKTMAYNSSEHLQPTMTTDSMSDGTKIITNDYYPEEKSSIANLNSSQSSALDSMKQMHNLATLIQQKVTRDNNSVSLLKNDYQILAANRIYPDSVELQTSISPIETRIKYSSYDSKGNVLQDTQAGGVTNSYIWDYNSQYPIAQVTNASQANIAYTSFEANGNGNWTISTTGRSTGAITGKQSYQLNGNSLNKTGLSSTITYILSYWTTSDTPIAIPGTLTGYPIKGKILNGWTYYEYQFTGQTSLTLTGTTGFNIDEVRLYPVNALMKTYTYDALIGMTSSVNETSEITFYEHDNLGRLINIKDQYGNIIKSFCYNYKGQVSNCKVATQIFTSALAQNTFQKVCGTGYTGSMVVYTVPAGSYTSTISQADANNKAVNDVTANGQNYANANGTCLQNFNFVVSNNAGAVGMNITFSGTNGTYTFLVSSSGGIFQVPTGIYQLNVGPDQSYHPHHILLGTTPTSPAYNPSGSFYSVNIASGGDLNLYINN